MRSDHPPVRGLSGKLFALTMLLFLAAFVGFALLFIPAAVHKLANRSPFKAILQAYDIVPERLTGSAARLIPLVELLLGSAWLMSGILNLPAATIAVMSALLLGLYTTGIAVNLLRGRSYIDCGCGFSTTIATADKGGTEQHLSSGLIVRNVLLMTTALVAVIPTAVREFLIIDYFNLLGTTIALVLLYGAFNQLLINRNAINAWRKSHG